MNFLLDDVKYKDRDFVLIDESHNFRYPDTQRYKVCKPFWPTGRRCCFLTATPRNKSAWDVYYQIKLFHQDDKTDLPVTPPDLKEYFKLVEKGAKKLPDLLANILVRRTRNHILRWYGFDSVTHQQVDPSRFKEYLDGNRRAYVMVAGTAPVLPQARTGNHRVQHRGHVSRALSGIAWIFGEGAEQKATRQDSARPDPVECPDLCPLWPLALCCRGKTTPRTLRQPAPGRWQPCAV